MSAGDRKARMLEWMAYADGELDELEAERLAEQLAEDPEAIATVEAFRDLGEHVRQQKTVVPDLTDAIMAKIEAEVPQTRSAAAKVLDLAEARARRTKLTAGVAALAAAAAAVALWVGRPLSEGAVAPEFASSALGVEVQQVDSRENVTVFSIPALHSNASSVVVWLGDDHQDDGADDSADEATPDAQPPGTP